MSTITLTTATASLTLVGGRATTTVSVTNSGTQPERVTLGVFPSATGASTPSSTPTPPPSTPPATGAAPAAGAPPAPPPAPAEWVVVDRPTRDLAAGQTEQFVVTCTAPPTLPAGSHRVRLIAYSATQAPEENAAQARELEIVAPAPPVSPVKAGMPWWIWAIAAALVVAVVAVGFAVLRNRGETPPPPPPSSTVSASTTPLPSGRCVEGYVERRARPADVVCVLPASALQAEFDNRPEVQKARKNDPPGGPYGPETCRVGWVWRDAFPGDTICVTGDIRSRTAKENEEAPLHRRPIFPTAVITGLPPLTT